MNVSSRADWVTSKSKAQTSSDQSKKTFKEFATKYFFLHSSWLNCSRIRKVIFSRYRMTSFPMCCMCVWILLCKCSCCSVGCCIRRLVLYVCFSTEFFWHPPSVPLASQFVNVRAVVMLAAFGNMCCTCVWILLCKCSCCSVGCCIRRLVLYVCFSTDFFYPPSVHLASQSVNARAVMLLAVFGSMCCMCVWFVCVSVRVVLLIDWCIRRLVLYQQQVSWILPSICRFYIRHCALLSTTPRSSSVVRTGQLVHEVAGLYLCVTVPTNNNF